MIIIIDNNRYVVDCEIGKGSFGKVVKAFDKKRSIFVAIKVVKSWTPFWKQAQMEIKLLKYLRKHDLHDKWNIGVCVCVCMCVCVCGCVCVRV